MHQATNLRTPLHVTTRSHYGRTRHKRGIEWAPRAHPNTLSNDVRKFKYGVDRHQDDETKSND